ncbi:MAG: ATP-binding protein [candidate division KSB1 bacterium]|nr:ATP-binding protein [candidate division KSB1 bacterium]MDZ7276411.1 ATP-binding protein [candidate division KSB1 bacterium]MDZ7288082.1 ATP-binding protein [candidate division KSB1 bacterium]MDZ7300182.1 ATP-binding protein [candidate division KSB1 bacterium]MDZ7305754.1 ATP-binding protein [candidate division KSB1 bacterium]
MPFSLMKSSRALVILVSGMIVLVLAIVNLGSWFFLNRMEDSLEQELGMRLRAVARLSAELVESGAFARYLEHAQELSARLLAQPILERMPGAIGVQQMYLIDRHWRILASSDPELFPPGRELAYLREDSAEVAAAWAGRESISALRRIGESRFKSAYAPITSTGGDVLCILVVEANADFFDMLVRFRRGLIGIGVLSLAALLVLAAALASAVAWFLRTQENLRRAERLAAMGQMAATVAHEIRNPLSIIKNTAEVLRQKYAPAALADELFEFIPSEVRRLNRLVTDFLTFARDRELRLVRRDLAQTIAKAIALARNQDQGAGLTWHFAPAAPVRVAHDEDAIMQVLMNLFLNAAQAMEGRGNITVTLHDLRPGKKQVHLTIHDNGPGLPAPPEKIFEPFFTTKAQGAGLGLAVAKQIIEKHHGRLAAESEKGGGTTMHIWLPAENS